MRHVVGGRAKERTIASTSQMGRFETDVLTQPSSQLVLMNLPGMWIDRLRERKSVTRAILDMDSSVSETHGQQEGSAYNSHFECTCCHPLKWTRLSCHGFADNRVRLQLFALAHNLGNFPRRLALPHIVKLWSLTTLGEKLIKIGTTLVHHPRSVVFQMAEVAVPRKLFRLILERIRRLRLPTAVSG